MPKKFLIALLSVTLIPVAHAQLNDTGSQKTKLSDLLSGSGLQLKLGWYDRFVDKKASVFYSGSFKGRSLFSFGDPPSGSTIADDPIDFGDQPLSLKIENGMTTVGGSLLKNFTAIPLNFKIDSPSSLRFVFAADAQFQASHQGNLLYGFEYKPNLSGLVHLKDNTYESFLGLGAATEQHTVAGGGKKTITAAQYRGRIGFGVDFQKSKKRTDENQADHAKLIPLVKEGFDNVAEGASTEAAFARYRENLARYRRKYLSSPGAFQTASLLPQGTGFTAQDFSAMTLQQKSEAIQRIASAATFDDSLNALFDLGEATARNATPADQVRNLGFAAGLDAQTSMTLARTLYLQLASNVATSNVDDAPKDQPHWQIYSEFEGSYSLSREIFNARYRSIWSANFRYNFDPKDSDRFYLSVRYENGFTRAEPDKRSNFFVATLGIKF